MTAADAKRAFKQWCDMNGYVVRMYKKTRTKINVKVDSYETELNEDERAAFVEGAIHGIHALFEILTFSAILITLLLLSVNIYEYIGSIL